jgi:hypothetical protein
MTLPSGQFEELADLVWALANDRLDDGGTGRLQQLLDADAANRRVYIELMDQFAALEWEKGEAARADGGRRSEEVAGGRWPEASGHQQSSITDQQSANPQSPFPTPFPLPTIHYPLSTVSASLFSGWLVAYLIATVILGIGLLIGAVTHVSQPDQFAQKTRPSPSGGRHEVVEAGGEGNWLPSPSGRGAGGEGDAAEDTLRPSVVGQITGMIECKFAAGSRLPSPASGRGARGEGGPSPGSPLHLGSKFVLISGLLEITYDSGARVILQGPVTYQVESSASGYLSIGKLTAKVEQGSEVSNHKSEIINPKFVIRTPTALVTDLGTEFGVEVTNSGETSSHVFRGMVEVQPTDARTRPTGKAIRLRENESVRLHQVSGSLAVLRAAIDPATFMRAEHFATIAGTRMPTPLGRWQAYSAQLRKDPALVAYYTFESVGKDSWLLPNVAATGPAMDAPIEGPLWTFGRLPGKLALRFRGPGTTDKVVLPEPQRFAFTTPFSIAVWFKVSQFQSDSTPTLIAKGTAWRVQRYGNNTNCMAVGTVTQPINGQYYDLPQPRTEVTDGRWHHLVVVIEPSDTSHLKRLYMDGSLESELKVPVPLGKNDDPVLLGQSSSFADREFEGLIDEVAILARAISAKEVATMFNVGTPTNTSAKEADNK